MGYQKAFSLIFKMSLEGIFRRASHWAPRRHGDAVNLLCDSVPLDRTFRVLLAEVLLHDLTHPSFPTYRTNGR